MKFGRPASPLDRKVKRTKMAINLKLGYGMAMELGFTPHRVHGRYFDRHVLWVPSHEYCKKVMKEFRDGVTSLPKQGIQSQEQSGETVA